MKLVFLLLLGVSSLGNASEWEFKVTEITSALSQPQKLSFSVTDSSKRQVELTEEGEYVARGDAISLEKTFYSQNSLESYVRDSFCVREILFKTVYFRRIEYFLSGPLTFYKTDVSLNEKATRFQIKGIKSGKESTLDVSCKK